MKSCSYKGCELENCRDEEYCIIHSPNREKKLNAFIEILKKITLKDFLATQSINFKSIHFPLNFDIDKFIKSVTLGRPISHLKIESCTFSDPLSITKSNVHHIEFKLNVAKSCELSLINTRESLLFDSNTFDKIEIDRSEISQMTFISSSPGNSTSQKKDNLFLILNTIDGVQISNQVFHSIHFASTHFTGSVYANNIESTIFLIRESFFHENVNLTEFKCSQFFYLKNCICIKPELVTISKSDLTNSGFKGTDVSKFNFIDNIWKNDAKNAIKIFDHRIAEKGKPYDDKKFPYIKVSPIECAETYRQLKKNFESKGNYIDAGNFHYGEMEMRRLSEKKFFTKYLSINALYKYLSGYGEQPVKAVVILFLSIILLSCVQVLSGFEIDGSIINYDIHISNPVRLCSLNDYLASIKLTFGNLTLRNISKINMVHNSTNTILWIFETLFGPTQLALIVLSIKRKVKR